MIMLNLKECCAPAALLVIVLIPMGCQTMDIKETVKNDLSCEAFEPISWSNKDSIKTIKQIIEHNAAWNELCK